MKKAMDSNQKRTNRKRINNQKFLEALRGLGDGVVDSAANDVVKGVAESALNQVTGRKTGELKPDQAVDLKEIGQEERKASDFQREFFELQRQEKTIFTRGEQETRLQIAAVLEELKQLAQSTKGLAKEVEIAAHQVPVEPGTYHLNFFEKLREAILTFKKRVEEATTWLAAFNQRSKKRSYYWTQVKKSGTKFMLSQERYMATQAG